MIENLSPLHVWSSVTTDCGVEKKLKDWKLHCENAHGKPLRQKGQLSLSESFFKPGKPHKPAKRAKTAHPIVAPEIQS